MNEEVAAGNISQTFYLVLNVLAHKILVRHSGPKIYDGSTQPCFARELKWRGKWSHMLNLRDGGVLIHLIRTLGGNFCSVS